MKDKVTSAAIVASVAIIIGWAVISVIPALAGNTFRDYRGELQWDALFTRAASTVALQASLIAGVAAVGAWFQSVRIRVALIAAGIASIGWAINLVWSDDEDIATVLLAMAVGVPILGALVAMIVVVVATAITRARRVVQEETYRVVQEHQKEEPNGPDLK